MTWREEEDKERPRTRLKERDGERKSEGEAR